MRIGISALAGVFDLSLIAPAAAATKHRSEVEVTWEQCHIQNIAAWL
jgi:hypothetical protein